MVCRDGYFWEENGATREKVRENWLVGENVGGRDCEIAVGVGVRILTANQQRLTITSQHKSIEMCT